MTYNNIKFILIIWRKKRGIKEFQLTETSLSEQRTIRTNTLVVDIQNLCILTCPARIIINLLMEVFVTSLLSRLWVRLCRGGSD